MLKINTFPGKQRRPRWSFCVPPCILDGKTKKFSNAIMAIVFAYYHLLLVNQRDIATFTAFRECSKAPQYMEKECWQFILTQLNPFLTILDGELDADVYDILQKLDDKTISYCDNSGSYDFHVQAYIFHKHSGTLLAKYPEKLDASREKLFFISEYTNGKFFDTEIITNWITFFNVFGYFCLFCEKKFRGKSSQHNCSKIATCFVCKRPFLNNLCRTEKHELGAFEQFYFCCSRQTVEEALRCKKCNLLVFSQDCLKHHRKNVCKFGWFCLDCEKYTFRSKFSPSLEAIQKSHVCGMKLCKICGALYRTGDRHQCQFTTPQKMCSLTKLGFIDIQLSGSSPLFCRDCFSLDGQRCSFCADNNSVQPTICTILYETVRGKFSSATSILNQNKSTTLTEENDTYAHDYLPKECTKLPCEKRTFFQKIPKLYMNTDKILLKNNMSPVEEILHLIFVKKIFHTTFLSHNIDNGYVLNELFKVFVEQGLTPIFTGCPKLLILEIPEIGLRFMNLTNYIEQSLQLQGNICFFPQRWNKEAFLSYIGSAPTINDFFNAEDTSAIMQKKEKFVGQQPNLWNFQKALKEFCHNRIHCMFNITINFIQEAFSCQNLLYTITKPETYKTYIMPFNPPLFTRASYAFQLLLLYSKDISKLKVPLPPIAMQSSKQELEFCGYLRWKFPHLQFTDAWSETGQKRFKESFPDSFCRATKTAFYFHGCLIHGHEKNLCKFKRKSLKEENYFKVPFVQAREQHELKIRKLLTNHSDEIENIETVWECEWQALKKHQKM